MVKGFGATWLLDRKGEVFAIGTGSDATAEHECGSAPLIREMCGAEPLYVKPVAEAILAGRMSTVPDILAGRQVLPGLKELVFSEGMDFDGAPAAAIGFTSRCYTLANLVNHRELSMSRYDVEKGRFCSGAWDESSFGFRVRGDKNVAKLRKFYDALQAGRCMHAGLFLAATELSGVILCDMTKLRPEHRVQMAAAQKRFASKVDELLSSKAVARAA